MFIPPAAVPVLERARVDPEAMSRSPTTTHLWPPIARRVSEISVAPNKNPYTVAPSMSAAVWLLIAAALAFLVMRTYSKMMRHKGLWWDDYILAAAWVGQELPLYLPTHMAISGTHPHRRTPG